MRSARYAMPVEQLPLSVLASLSTKTDSLSGRAGAQKIIREAWRAGAALTDPTEVQQQLDGAFACLRIMGDFQEEVVGLVGQGEPPHELLLAAVACAARGTVRGVPVQQLQEDDAIGSLNLDRSGLGVISAELLGLMLLAVTSVHTLSLQSNRLGPDGGAALAEGLKGNSMLHSLNLRDNRLGPQGGAALAESIKGNTTLQSLDLGDNQLCGVNYSGVGTYTTEGITKLCEALKGSAVTKLDLAFNQLCGLDGRGCGTYTAEGITKLCEGLKESAVTSLNLNRNHLGPEGGAALAEGLKGNSTLRSLDLKYNNLNSQAKRAVKDAAGSSVSITF
jgi:hypothetical protein